MINFLHQVSHLFADHPDLLMEFTYFLPDAVQDQAKERLARAARESELRRSKALAAQGANAQAPVANGSASAPGGPVLSQKQRAKLERDSLKAAEKELKLHQKAQQLALAQAAAGNKKANKKRALAASASLLPSAGTGAGTAPPADMYIGTLPQPIGNIGTAYHSISTERRFFDQIKDLLTSSSRDGWSEFVKCLDLYSHDAISRRDMFLLVQELFGPSNVDLYDEFKALLSARSAYDSSQQDMWFSIPLSEIDFSQCRRCTPSYRILPSDYPRPISSGREAHKESAVLNDEWVSIPIGSEESTSFKQMRKNQYEESLFRSEDDRFDIDMVIDSNTSCIRLLEPIAEEIQHLKSLEDQEGGAPKFSLQLEKNSLGVIHLNAIARIYGEHGGEILGKYSAERLKDWSAGRSCVFF